MRACVAHLRGSSRIFRFLCFSLSFPSSRSVLTSSSVVSRKWSARVSLKQMSGNVKGDLHPYKVRVYPTEHFFHQNCWALVQNKPIYMSAKNRPLQPHTASRRGAYEHGRDRASKAVADRVPQGCEYDVLYRVFQSKPKVAMSGVLMGELPRA